MNVLFLCSMEKHLERCQGVNCSLNLKEDILHIIKELYTSNSAKVCVVDYTSDPFNINYGVMQGCNLWPIMFLIYIIDQILQLNKSNWDTILSALGFADDIVFLSNRSANLQMLIGMSLRLTSAR